MALDNLLKVFVASFFFLASVLAAGDASNASQHVVANTMDDSSVDMTKVQKYKSLFSEYQDQDRQRPVFDEIIQDAEEALSIDKVFDNAFKWKDIIHGSPLSADCPPQCYACAAGCNPACCLVAGGHGPNFQPGRPPKGGKKDSEPADSSAADRPSYGFPVFRPFPIPPLACPCHCEASCPRNIQAICCFTPGSSAKDSKDETSEREGGGAADSHDQKPIVDTNDHIWWRPAGPLDCPCHCEADCPAYVQAICCTTPGTGSTDQEPAAPPAHEVLAMVTETAAGDPVSVLAGINITVFDSFITMDLVQGLERASEISANIDLKIFEITLPVVVGPKGKEQTLKHSFQVIDGSKLLEKEQIMLGLGFMARIDALAVKEEFLTPLEEGLPVLTGTKS
ncbi:uncharacterized protein Z518_03733 [Rhinocladiella mackenziei CBS 650.93]|uniref:Uncharacterized protein n=1 Tax=Rhinocladiella mackenziei CBS 650.93 TaxID=1442369 RepID=A0A0D2IRH0_9EURO|nr:uncharacterized protein Z518_03733 [Rhinocladiella mackenziei CBS 650.93]KIX05761.1 hypothetical protein Z518_03733 [Rhinocladiella mackenziei CBS 650.93]